MGRMEVIAALLLSVAGCGQQSQAAEESRLQACTGRVEALEARVAAAEGLIGTVEGQATKLAQTLTGLAQPVTAAVDKAKAREAAAAGREAVVAAREQEVARATAAIEASSFGDGTWEVGRDIQPGKYRTENLGDEQGCYWEKSTGGEGVDAIIDNDGAEGPTTVVIGGKVRFFKSRDCGIWRLIP